MPADDIDDLDGPGAGLGLGAGATAGMSALGDLGDLPEVDGDARERMRTRALARGGQIKRRRTNIRRGGTVAAVLVLAGGAVLIGRAATRTDSINAINSSTTTTLGVGSSTITTSTSPTSTTVGPGTTTTTSGGGPTTTSFPTTTTISAPTTTQPVTTTTAPVGPPTTTEGSHNPTTTTMIPPSWAFSASSGGDLDLLSCGPSSLCVAAAAGGDGAIVSSSLGAEWSFHSLPASVNGLSCGDDAHCVIVATSATTPEFLVTADGAGTWTAVAAPPSVTSLTNVSCSSGSQCVAIASQPAKTGAGGNVAGSVPTAYSTSDGGTTWAEQGQLGGAVSELDCLAGSTECLAAVGAGLEITANSGATWSAFGSSLAASPSALTCPSASYCLAGEGGAIQVTTSGGSSWAGATLPAGVTAITGLACAGDGECWAAATESSSTGSAGELIVSSDGGLDWNNDTTVPAPANSFGNVTCAPAACVGVGPDLTALHLN